MTIWFYIKTDEDPKTVGDHICSYSFIQGIHPEDKYFWVLESGKDDYWVIKGKYAPLKEHTVIAYVYSVGDTVVLSQIDDTLAPVFIDPLIERYGFDKVKWIVVPMLR
jgi:hypothetical protein